MILYLASEIIHLNYIELNKFIFFSIPRKMRGDFNFIQLSRERNLELFIKLGIFFHSMKPLKRDEMLEIKFVCVHVVWGK